MKLDIVVIGLSLSSSWGNGHATTYRALLRALARRGHRVTFLERDVPWYAENRDLPEPEFCTLSLYGSLDELRDRHAEAVRNADLVIVGSYVPDGPTVIDWVTRTARGRTAFYDIDTPVTLRSLLDGSCAYLTLPQVSAFDFYLSFTGGPTLDLLERRFGARRAYPLYCSFDAETAAPEDVPRRYDLGYMGTYSADRQPTVEALLLEVARRRPAESFVVAGPLYPPDLAFPVNVEHVPHLPPAEHRTFYCAQRFTLNVTRADMRAAGYSPSVRLFEAAACGTPIISDVWPGIDELFAPGREIVLARGTSDVLDALERLDERARATLARRARRRVLGEHTPEHRAVALERYVAGCASAQPARTPVRRRGSGHA